MTSDDKKRFAVVMGVFSQAFGVEVSNSRIRIYFEAFNDLSIEAVEDACQRIIKTEMAFPCPAMVRSYANSFRKPAVQNLETPAIPEGFVTPDVARERIQQIYAMLESKFSTSH
jgi:hypothetical protein